MTGHLPLARHVLKAGRMCHRMMRGPLLVIIVALLGAPAAVDADGFSLPRDGRTIAQAGGLAARAPDPSAVTHNPAGIVRLPGLQIVVGGGFDSQRHDIAGRPGENTLLYGNSSPAAYVTWRPAGHARWAVGIGLASSFRYREEQPPKRRFIFPIGGTFEMAVTQVHPVAAFAIDEHWSLGGGIRHLSGTLRETYFTSLATGRGPGGPRASGNTYVVVGRRSAKADIAAWAADVSVSFRENAWGLGAVFSTGADLVGEADLEVEPLNEGPAEAVPRVAASLAYLRHEAPRRVGFDIAPELRLAGWVAAGPRLRVELDLVRAFWSETGWYRPQESGGCESSCGTNTNPPREWRDTLSIRLAVERDLGRRFQLRAGIAREPAAVPSDERDKAGDALVFAAGASLNLHRLSLDAGYSQDVGFSPIRHVVAFSVRSRF